MTNRRSIHMLTNTGDTLEVTGDKIRADSYWGYSDGMHTVAVHYNNFTGGYKIQGTLSIDPQDDDWFDIDTGDIDVDAGYVIYPANPLAPTGPIGDTGVKAYTFTGNFTYLRVVVSRSYIVPTPGGELGAIDKVLLSL